MIRAAALLAIASVAALTINDTTIDKHLLKRLSSYIDSNKTIDLDKLRNLNKTVLLNKELVTILNNYVNEQNESKPMQSKVSDDTESYSVYENGKKGSTLVESIEESPDYASSIVLASDVLSLTSAVSNIEDEVCREQGYQFLDGLLQNKRWALKMFDASSKSPEGLLYGSSYHLGNFDECIGIHDEGETVTVDGQYCLATIKWPQPQETKKSRLGRGEILRWAVCVPSACDAKAVERFVGDVLARSVGNKTTVRVEHRDCYFKEPITVSTNDVAFLSVMLFFLTIIFISTAYESACLLRRSKSKTITHQLIVSFSLINNGKKILFTEQNNSMGLDCISGIKTLSMVFILSGHTSLFVGTGPVMDESGWDNAVKNPNNSLILNSMLLVDTFLMLSAFLFSRLLLAELDKRRGKLNVIPIILFRYIRLTPSYLAVIWFYITWMPKIGEGPLWKEKVMLEQERCRENWWINILYVNNFVHSDTMCMFQSWYLSVDTQLFLVAPIFIYALWRWRRAGPILLGLSIAVSVAVTAIITYKDDLDPTLMIYAKEFTDLISNYYFHKAYIKTYMKMTTYFMGLLTGYILHRVQTENYEFTRLLKVFGWITNIILGTVTMFLVSIFYQDWYAYNNIESAAYASLSKLSWGIANGWLIIACATGNGGILNKLLTWKVFVPFARLTYSAYLVNGLVELFYLGQLRHPLHITTYSLVEYALSHLMLTFFFGALLCLIFESPIHGIEKILLNKFVHSKSREAARKEQSQGSSRSTSQSKLES
ncbi:nose resistant to fluoxetine protein 6-like [Ostrinia furnacalis]|uniref:nose resistant to fluoxetine protein 6-like n=1 Tax=Ostrinia furnacalis TaxID=93504 RepID=UPI00103E0427|nr:nose resistant to fluoxetine protein 6-like [Ostrinia furnacalis]